MADNFATDSSGNVASRNFAGDEVTYPPSGSSGRIVAPVTVGEASGSIGSRAFTPWNGSNPVPTKLGGVASATTSTPSMSTSSAQIFAANTARREMHFNNTLAAVLYIKFGTAASSTSFTKAIDPGGDWSYYGVYQGVVHGILASGSGTPPCTEV